MNDHFSGTVIYMHKALLIYKPIMENVTKGTSYGQNHEFSSSI